MKALTKTKVFLRNRETGQSSEVSSGWTAISFLAHNFDTVESAVKFARTQGLVDMEVVLRSDDFACNLVVPVTQAG